MKKKQLHLVANSLQAFIMFSEGMVAYFQKFHFNHTTVPRPLKSERGPASWARVAKVMNNDNFSEDYKAFNASNTAMMLII
jgi:hypothetical protein